MLADQSREVSKDHNFRDVQERQIRCGGYLTRYLEAGDPHRDPVLLIHDGAWGASSSTTWGSFIPELSEEYHVLAPDLLGYGGSDKVVFLDRSQHDFRIEHLSEFVKAKNISRPIHVVGNSFGGSNALRALAKPGSFDFRSVVSIAGSGGPWRTSTALEQMGHWDGTRDDLTRVLRLLVDYDYPGFSDQLAERNKWANAPGHYKAILAPSVPTPSNVKQLVSDPWPSQIANVTVPILLVNCLRDELLESSWTASLQAVLPYSKIVDIDCKHAPQLDHPRELRRVLTEFFDSVRAQENVPNHLGSHGR